jgi:hypothetical protein
VKRNEIEHKKFIIGDEKELMLLLFYIIEEIVIFSHNAFIFDDIGRNFIKKWKDEYVESYMEIKAKFDDDFKKIIERIKSIKEKNKIELMLCYKCFLKTIPYKNEIGKIKCLNCGIELYGIECDTCKNIFFINENDDQYFMFNRCGHCEMMSPEEEEAMIADHEAMEEENDKALKEIKDSFSYQKFE